MDGQPSSAGVMVLEPDHQQRQQQQQHGSQQDSDSDDDDQSPLGGSGPSTSASQLAARKRKRERACDHCRSRKVRCDGYQFEDRVCMLCRKSGITCSYVMKSKKRNNPPRPSSGSGPSVTKVQPSPAESSTARSAAGGGSEDVKRSQAEADHEAAQSMMLVFRPQTLPHPDSPQSQAPTPPARPPPSSRLYMGQSSTLWLTQAAARLARGNAKPPPPPRPAPTTPGQAAAPVFSLGASPVWETPEYADSLCGLDFWPPDDLAAALFDSFFERIHPVLPFLREGPFRVRIRDRDYLSDIGLRNVCLMIFAVTSSHGFSDSRCWAPEDPRNPAMPSRLGLHSSGWAFYHQSTRHPRSRLRPASLYDLQISILTAIFLGHSSNPTVAWVVLGEGLVFAKELGAHRGDVPLNDDPAVCDLLRRSFWSLHVLDSELSAATGRPPHIALGSYDAPLPIHEWDGVPDTDINAFVLLIEAAELLRKSVETMYSIANQSRTKTWTLQQMAMLTAEIDAFQYALPPNLRWTASQIDTRLFHQATTIQLIVYSARIYVTRSALPQAQAPTQPSISTSFCEVCVASASKISVILESQTLRSGPGLPLLSPALQIAGSVLAIALFGGTAAGLVDDEAGLEEGLKRCYRINKSSQTLWAPAAMRTGWINQLLLLRGAGVPPAEPTPSLAPQSSANPTAAESLLALAQYGTGSAPTTQVSAPSLANPQFDPQGSMPFDFDFGLFPFTGEAANENDLSWWYGDLGAGLG